MLGNGPSFLHKLEHDAETQEEARGRINFAITVSLFWPALEKCQKEIGLKESVAKAILEVFAKLANAICLVEGYTGAGKPRASSVPGSQPHCVVAGWRSQQRHKGV